MSLAVFLTDVRGDFDAAETLYIRSLNTHERTSGPDHPNTLLSASNYANFLACNRKNHVDSLILFRRVAETRKRLLGDTHEDFLKASEDLAISLYYNDDAEEALGLLKHVYSIRRDKFAVLQTDQCASILADTLENIAALYEEMEFIDEAKSARDEAASLQEQ